MLQATKREAYQEMVYAYNHMLEVIESVGKINGEDVW